MIISKRIIALLLSILMLFGSSVTLLSCSEELPYEQEGSGITDDNGKSPSDDNDGSPDGDNPDDEHIKVPEYKDHERGTINFSQIIYTRPDADKIIQKFNTVTDLIKENPEDKPYLVQLDAVASLEEDYSEMTTMYTYSNIKMSENTADEYWCQEYEYIAMMYPAFMKSVEDLFVAAAGSPHANSFENDYFGDGLIEEYKDGGSYTDRLIKLMEQETALETEYSSISTANTVIAYRGMYDTVDNILTYYRDTFGEDTAYYSLAMMECTEIYEKTVSKRTREIFVDLIKIRHLISDEYGYESYSKIAYEDYHDYSEEQAVKFIRDIAKYIMPVYTKLNNFVFRPYFFAHTSSPSPKPNKIINDLGSIYESYDKDIYAIYSYMLQHGLYSCEKAKENRYEGSFATYLNTYNAPYLFTTLYGDFDDYMTVSHEFGHFIDSYVNYGKETSLDLMEVSSTAFEFLTLNELLSSLSDEDSKYLSYSKFESAMQVLIYQSFYALFEHYAYSIPYENISQESLASAMKTAAEDMGFRISENASLELVIIPHTVLYPFYVQSYCTSTAVALQIYFLEAENEGYGLSAYKSLIDRCTEQSFVQHLNRADLCSPFEANILKKLADSIHFEILGSHYYTDGGDSENTA